MTKLVMRRRAADNRYLHKDFHGALSCGIGYLQEHFGEDAVRQYLRRFALTYYAPLREQLRARGLDALEAHLRELYEIEGANAVFERHEDELVVRVAACPAVRHMRERGFPVAPLFHETTATVNRALCEGTPFEAELVVYDRTTGRSVQRFRRRSA
ncbi:MAG: hypothetical protein GXP31_01635 [Kiritimatiellaeota bacterium]|nr:hypothetical protein [Kiritimatiellota bacterium]